MPNSLLASLLQARPILTFARVFASLLTLPEDEALVYHCSAGKDRTGMTTALILKGLGVDEHTIARDYLLTNELYTFGLKSNFK